MDYVDTVLKDRMCNFEIESFRLLAFLPCKGKHLNSVYRVELVGWMANLSLVREYIYHGRGRAGEQKPLVNQHPASFTSFLKSHRRNFPT